MIKIDMEAASSGGLAIRKGVTFPKNLFSRTIIKEIVVHDILGQPVFKGMAVPDTP
jgi:hypothetical protein